MHFNRGLALARAGRPLEARYAYDRALELDPAFSEALVNRAMVELELNELAAALHDLLRSIELGRDDLVAMTSLGETLARMGRRDEAERYFARLLARNPGSLVVRVARGYHPHRGRPGRRTSDLARRARPGAAPRSRPLWHGALDARHQPQGSTRAPRAMRFSLIPT